MRVLFSILVIIALSPAAIGQSIAVKSALMRPVDYAVGDWERAIQANAGSIGADAKRHASTFVRGLRSDGTWHRIDECAAFAGVTQLTGALVKIKTVPGISRVLTNVNFVSGDYSPTGATIGLLGNGSNKYLNTHAPQSTFSGANRHLAIYESARATETFSVSIGGEGASANVHAWALMVPGINEMEQFYCSASISGPSVTGQSGKAIWIGDNSSATAGALYRNGLQVNAGGFSAATPHANPVYVFALNRGNSPSDTSNARIAFYSIGKSLGATGAAQLSTRINNLMASFGSAAY